jgi:lysophospholipase L1-like esterase
MRRNLPLLLVALVVVLVPAELYLRARAARARDAIRAGMDERELCTTASPDPRLLYTYQPNECGANSQGYRDVEHSFEKPESTYRIVLIGDSVAEGRDVPPDSAFGRVLERLLNARDDGRRYEVILLARIGYSTSQELVLLEEEAFRYEPDMILWSYCLNDPADPVYHNANGALGAFYYRPRCQLVALAKAFVFRARQKWHGRGCPQEFHAFIHCAYWDEVRKNIARIKRASQRCEQTVFLVHPVFEDRADFSRYELGNVHYSVLHEAQSAGLAAFDLLSAFRAHDPHELKINRADYFDPWHMNELGHRVTAEFIASRVAPRGQGSRL